MMKLSAAGYAILSAGLLLAGRATAADGPTTHPAELFGFSNLHTVRIHLSANAWRMMQPTHGQYVPPKPTTHPTTAPEGQRLAPGPAGWEYAYVRGQVDFDGRIFENVGVRLKGNASYNVAMETLRRPYKLDFARFDSSRTFEGVTTLNLSNSAFDASNMREPLAYATFREADLPSPRTAGALLYLTIDGLTKDEFLGLYVIVEEIDERFLMRHFSSAGGLLLKPEGIRGLPYPGEDWEAWQARYRPKGTADPKLARRFVEFVKLVNQADDRTFRAQIESYLAIDNFLGFVAVNAVIANLDSFLATGHNYCMYMHPQTGRIHFIPWDMSLAFAGYTWVGSGADQADLSIAHPHAGFNRLIQRVLAIDEYNQRYRQIIEELIQGPFRPMHMLTKIDLQRRLVEQSGAAARVAGRAGSPTTRPALGFHFDPPPLPEWVLQRFHSLIAQLDGKRAGYIPAFRRPELLPLPYAQVAPLANLFFAKIDADHDGRVTPEELTAAIKDLFTAADVEKRGFADEKQLAAALAKILPPPDRGYSTPTAWARAIAAQADADRNGQITLPELLSAAQRIIAAIDRDSDSALDGREMIEAFGYVRPGE